MPIKQLSVFVENEFGRLSDITQTLTDHAIDIRALSIADTTHFGVLRLIVSDPDRALQVLKDNSFAVSLTQVAAVRLDDEPGALNKVLQALKRHDIGVEYAYAFITRKADDAYLILRVEHLNDAVKALEREGFALLPESDVYAL